MARGGSFRTSICLVILFILGGSISFGILPLLSDAGQELPETSDGLLSQEGDSVVVDFPSAGASSSQLKLEIPHDQTLQTLGMTVSPHPKAREMAFTLDDWNHPDAINYDLSVEDGYLSVPKASSIEFDFESIDHGWSLASGGGWKVGHDSSLGLPGGVNSGSNALYSFDGNYPNSLSTTYWATSPPIECGECTGSWSLNYYRRLGVESSTWDHAYVQVRSVSGSWVQVYHNPSSTVNELQFTLQSHVVSSYVNGNDNFQVRFGIGRSDTIVQYTGWNVDDLSITCTTVCGGEIIPVDPGLGTLVYPNGSWTSPSFGYANGATYQWSEGPYASMNVDFAANPDAQWNWTVVNGTTFEPIEGHVNQTGEFVDLSSIDWEKYPSLRLKIEMAGNASGFGPQIRSINGGGALNDAFFTQPSPSNWDLNGSEYVPLHENLPDTRGCGYDENMAKITIDADYNSYVEGETFAAEIYADCQLIGISTRVNWQLQTNSGLILDNGIFSYTPGSQSKTLSLTGQNPFTQSYVPSLTLTATIESENISTGFFDELASDVIFFDVYENDVCGQNEHLTSVEISSVNDTYMPLDTFSGEIFSRCVPVGDSMKTQWQITNSDGDLITSGSDLWVGGSIPFDSSSITSNAIYNITGGDYLFSANISRLNTSSNQYVEFDSDSIQFEILNQSDVGSGPFEFQSDCGTDGNDSTVEIHSGYQSYAIGEQFLGAYAVGCNLVEKPVQLNWWIENSTGFVLEGPNSEEWTSTLLSKFATISAPSFAPSYPGDFLLQSSLNQQDETGNWEEISTSNSTFTYSENEGCSVAEENSFIVSYDSGMTLYDEESYSATISTGCLIPDKGERIKIDWDILSTDGSLVDSGSDIWPSHSILSRMSTTFTSQFAKNSPQGEYVFKVMMYLEDSTNSSWSLLDSFEEPISKRTSQTIYGAIGGSITSAWLSPGLPFYAIEIDGVTHGNLKLEVMNDQGAWVTASFNAQHEFSHISYNAKLRIIGESSYWNVSEVSVEFIFSELPYAPFIDVGWDQEKEWSFENPSIGTWGWQDRFWDGNFSHQTTLTNNGQAVIDVWIPKQDIHHFQVTATDLDSANGLEGLNVLIGSQAIVSRDFFSTSKYQLEMDEQERATLFGELANRPAIFDREGQSFVLAKVEIIANPGRYLINGLGIGYHAQSEIEYGAMDWFVKTINSQRLNLPSSGTHEVPIYLQSESSSSLHIEINKMTYDDTASIVNSAVVNNSQTLTPSHKWRTFEASYALQQSTPNAVILDLRSDDASAQWILPISGNQIIGTGNSDVLIFHENPVEITGGQNTKQVSVHWRTSQHWDDQSEITIEMRLSLLDGFVTMPSRFSWGDQSHQASDNDIEIRSVTWSDSEGLLSSSHEYLKNGESLIIQTDIGFENAEIDEHPFQNEFELILMRRGTQLANVSDVGGAVWNFTDLVPLVAGEIEWNLSLIPTAGADYGDVTSVNRTFIVDSLAAQVVGCSIQKYDHKTSSIFQRVEINVTDRPILPSELTLMLWMEWVDDENNDGMPNEGEYQNIPLSSPANLDQPFGFYTATFSDVGGFDGQKVAGYVTGTDQAGIPIKNGGDYTEGNHLFMYQLMPDLSPVVLDDAMSWDKEITHWLHPGQSYTLYANFSEANGASDVETIELQLASNIASDRMSLFWHDSSNQCSSSSHHIEILSCSLLSDGVLADPFDKDLSLEIHLQLAWTTPELGELRREPALHVTDDGGQSSQINLPYLRWRFSPEMMIKDNVSLWVENGEETQDGARVAKNSILQLQGSLVFAHSDEIPDFNCEISTLINAKYQSFDAENGLFFAQVEAPSINGNYPLSWSIGCLPEQGRDVTDLQKSVFWIGVDADGPIPVEILSPRPNSILHHDIYPIQVMISEDFGIDVDSVTLHWWVTVTETDEQLAAGESTMQLNQTNQMGQRMQFDGVLDLNDVDEIWMQEELLCNVYLTGRDMAGNSFATAPNNSRNQPFHSWQMHYVQPEFVLTQNAVSLSKLQISVDETSAVQIDVQNIGSLEGEAEVTIEIIKLDGTSELLRRTNVQVDAVSRETLVVDWKPTNSGLQWVKVTIENQQAESAKVDVKELEPEGFMDGVFEQANPALLGFSIVGATLLGLLCLMWLRLVTYTRGYGDEAEYYDEEDFIDDDDDFDDEEEV